MEALEKRPPVAGPVGPAGPKGNNGPQGPAGKGLTPGQERMLTELPKVIEEAKKAPSIAQQFMALPLATRLGISLGSIGAAVMLAVGLASL